MAKAMSELQMTWAERLSVLGNFPIFTIYSQKRHEAKLISATESLEISHQPDQQIDLRPAWVSRHLSWSVFTFA